MTDALIAFSASISRLVQLAAPSLCAIRLAPNRHIAGLICPGGTLVTTDQVLPALDSYTIVLPNRTVTAACPGARDSDINLATLRLDAPWPVANPVFATTTVGSLAVVLGADADAAPTVRLTAVHRFVRTADGQAPVLDLPGETIGQGSLVLDPRGRLIGLATIGAQGEAMVVPGALIGRMVMPSQTGEFFHAAPQPQTATPAPPLAAVPGRPGWLGVALQPIMVPERLTALAGQSSGRLVVSITKGGPAAVAGVRIGDVLLALNGTSASGPQALRAFLGPDRVGTAVEVKLLRDGKMELAQLVVAEQPA